MRFFRRVPILFLPAFISLLGFFLLIPLASSRALTPPPPTPAGPVPSANTDTILALGAAVLLIVLVTVAISWYQARTKKVSD